MLLDVVNNGHRDEIANAHLTPQKKTNLGATDVVLDELLNDIDILLPGLQCGKRFVNVRSAALDDERL